MFEPRYREGQRERGLVGVSIRHIYVKIPPTKTRSCHSVGCDMMSRKTLRLCHQKTFRKIFTRSRF